ncbi:MAG: hypothetical protein AAF799_19960 [Myxococcota bacterium]
MRRPAAWRWGAALLMAGLTVGCPDPPKDPPPAAEDKPSESGTTPFDERDGFVRDAHVKALGALRTEALPALRLIDPVAAAQAEDTPLRPPDFGPALRVPLRKPLESARREAAGIDHSWLPPEDGVVLRTMQTGLTQGFQQIGRPMWRDDPSAVLYTLGPYLDALFRDAAAGKCDEGCGIEALASSLEAGFNAVGSASLSTTQTAHGELHALRVRLQSLARGPGPDDTRAPTHPLARAQEELRAAIARIDANLAKAEATLPTAEEVPWSSVLPRADADAWKRRPESWGADRLREWLTIHEAYGHDAQELFERALATVARLEAIRDRDAGAPDESPPLARPFDTAACEQAFAPIDAWAKAQPTHLQVALDCEAIVRELGPEPRSDAELLLAIIDRAIIDPTRLAQIKATGVDIALVRGRAAAVAQRSTLQVAVAAATKHRAAELLALSRAHQRICEAASALWVHAQLGSTEDLGTKLAPYDCGAPTDLVAVAKANPLAALEGLGMMLLGLGPADAAALDRYWWAPMGLVRDLAIPPAPKVDVPPNMRVEELTPESIQKGAEG